MINLTPQHLRCGPFNCPSVHELDDGRLLIVGQTAGLVADDEQVAKPGPDETAIIIDRALLADVPRNGMTPAQLAALMDWARSMARREIVCEIAGDPDGAYRREEDAMCDALYEAFGVDAVKAAAEAPGAAKASGVTDGA